jgi:hypothetical protein
MRKTLTALAVASTIAISTVAAPTSADARWRGWRGPAFFGGLAAGAIIAGAMARPYYYGSGYYGYGGPAYYYYAPRPYYYAPGPAYYYAPAPVQYEVYPVQPYPTCWAFRRGYRYYVC